MAIDVSVSELNFTPSPAPKWSRLCACCSVSTGTRCEAALVQGRNKVLSTFLSDAVTCELCCRDTSSPWHWMNCSRDQCAANFDNRSSVIYTKDNQMEAGKWEVEGETTNLFSLLGRGVTHQEPALVLWVNLQQHKEESQSLVGIASITRWVGFSSFMTWHLSFLWVVQTVQKQTAMYSQSEYSPWGKNVISSKLSLFVEISPFQCHFIQMKSGEFKWSNSNKTLQSFLWETVAWILSAYKINWSSWTLIKIKCFDCLQAISSA